jgi:hypothetical protein
MAMMALKIGAPMDYLHLLEEHADMVNLPRIGVNENFAFPAVQANIAPAVALHDALGNELTIFILHAYKFYYYFRDWSRKLNGFFWPFRRTHRRRG